MKHRRILKCLSARAVSQHASTLLPEFIGNHPTWSLMSGTRGEKKCKRKTKTNQNTADCSMLPVGQLEGKKKKRSFNAVCLAQAQPCPRGQPPQGREEHPPLPVLRGQGPGMGRGMVPAPQQGPPETLRWQLLLTALRLRRLWPK